MGHGYCAPRRLTRQERAAELSQNEQTFELWHDATERRRQLRYLRRRVAHCRNNLVDALAALAEVERQRL